MNPSKDLGETVDEARSLTERLEDAIRAKLLVTDIDALPLESLLDLLSATTAGFDVPLTKKRCVCRVVAVDDNEAAARGWACRCYKFGVVVRCSFKGPKIANWLGQGEVGTQGSSFVTHVTDPSSGEVYKIVYQYDCD